MSPARKSPAKKSAKSIKRRVAAPTMGPKYEFTGETKIHFGITLHRIRALVTMAAIGVAAGDLGGWIEKPECLSQVSGNAWVSGDAQVYGDARVYGDAQVSGNAWVSGDAQVYGDAQVSGNARVEQPIAAATRSDGYTFVVAPTKDGPPRIIAGCRYLGFEEARAHWQNTRRGTQLGAESLLIVDFLKQMARIRGWLTEPVKPAAE